MPTWTGWPWKSNAVAPSDGCTRGPAGAADQCFNLKTQVDSQGRKTRRCAERPAWLELSPFESKLVVAMLGPTTGQVQDNIQRELLEASTRGKQANCTKHRRRGRSQFAARGRSKGRRAETPDMALPRDAAATRAPTPWGLETIPEEEERRRGCLSRSNSSSSTSSLETSDYGISEDHPDMQKWKLP